MFDYIDSYCERTAPGFWDEPLNASTNVAFLIAAMVAVLAVRRITGLVKMNQVAGESHATAGMIRVTFVRMFDLWLLPVWLVSIGVSSFLFHTFANRLTALLDVLGILMFAFTFLAVFLGRVAGWRWWGIAIWMLALPAAAIGASAAYPSRISAYAPMGVSLLLIGLIAWQRHHRSAARLLWLSCGVFIISLAASAVDGAWCDAWPHGTHFLWHVLNGVVLSLTMIALGRALGMARSA